MQEDNILVGTLMEDACFTLEELVAASAVEPEWVMYQIREGFLPALGGEVGEWRFTSMHLLRVRRMRDVERNFAAAPELAALVADLLEDMDTLKARLNRAELV